MYIYHNKKKLRRFYESVALTTVKAIVVTRKTRIKLQKFKKFLAEATICPRDTIHPRHLGHYTYVCMYVYIFIYLNKRILYNTYYPAIFSILHNSKCKGLKQGHRRPMDIRRPRERYGSPTHNRQFSGGWPISRFAIKEITRTTCPHKCIINKTCKCSWNLWELNYKVQVLTTVGTFRI